MKRNKMFLTLAGAAVGAFMVYGSAQAAPVASNGLDALKTLTVGQSQVEQARCWRRCWRSGGYWHCRRRCHRWWW
jgi:hypothetical protein